MNLDALGNPLIEGATYGFCQSANAHTDIKLGVFTHFTETGRASLKIFRHTDCLYGDRKTTKEVDKRATVYPFKLFPVDRNQLSDIEK